MTNTTAVNESVNTTTNSTFWKPDFVMPEIGNMNAQLERIFIDSISSWGLDPEHTLFIIVELLTLMLIAYYLYVYSTSKSSGVFKWIFIVAALIIVLLMLEVI